MWKDWFRYKLYYPYYWKTVNCSRGVHAEIGATNGVRNNFCPACSAQINPLTYREFKVVDKQGQLDETVYAVNRYHAASFFRNIYHMENILIQDLGPVHGMTIAQWYKKMKPLADRSGYIMSQKDR
jgi:hypothetical protein